MVVIKVIESENAIIQMTISGHAASNECGRDLVCAGVSCISFGILNALDSLCPSICKLQMQEGLVQILVNEPNHHDTQTILRTAEIQFKTIQEKYRQYIKIHKQEV